MNPNNVSVVNFTLILHDRSPVSGFVYTNKTGTHWHPFWTFSFLLGHEPTVKWQKMSRSWHWCLLKLQNLFVPSAANITFVWLVCFLLTQVHYGTMDTRQIVVGLFKECIRVIYPAFFGFLLKKTLVSTQLGFHIPAGSFQKNIDILEIPKKRVYKEYRHTQGTFFPRLFYSVQPMINSDYGKYIQTKQQTFHSSVFAWNFLS